MPNTHLPKEKEMDSSIQWERLTDSVSFVGAGVISCVARQVTLIDPIAIGILIYSGINALSSQIFGKIFSGDSKLAHFFRVLSTVAAIAFVTISLPFLLTYFAVHSFVILSYETAVAIGLVHLLTKVTTFTVFRVGNWIKGAFFLPKKASQVETLSSEKIKQIKADFNKNPHKPESLPLRHQVALQKEFEKKEIPAFALTSFREVGENWTKEELNNLHEQDLSSLPLNKRQEVAQLFFSHNLPPQNRSLLREELPKIDLEKLPSPLGLGQAQWVHLYCRFNPTEKILPSVVKQFYGWKLPPVKDESILLVNPTSSKEFDKISPFEFAWYFNVYNANPIAWQNLKPEIQARFIRKFSEENLLHPSLADKIMDWIPFEKVHALYQYYTKDPSSFKDLPLQIQENLVAKFESIKAGSLDIFQKVKTQTSSLMGRVNWKNVGVAALIALVVFAPATAFLGPMLFRGNTSSPSQPNLSSEGNSSLTESNSPRIWLNQASIGFDNSQSIQNVIQPYFNPGAPQSSLLPFLSDFNHPTCPIQDRIDGIVFRNVNISNDNPTKDPLSSRILDQITSEEIEQKPSALGSISSNQISKQSATEKENQKFTTPPLILDKIRKPSDVKPTLTSKEPKQNKPFDNSTCLVPALQSNNPIPSSHAPSQITTSSKTNYLGLLLIPLAGFAALIWALLKKKEEVSKQVAVLNPEKIPQLQNSIAPNPFGQQPVNPPSQENNPLLQNITSTQIKPIAASVNQEQQLIQKSQNRASFQTLESFFQNPINPNSLFNFNPFVVSNQNSFQNPSVVGIEIIHPDQTKQQIAFEIPVENRGPFTHLIETLTKNNTGLLPRWRHRQVPKQQAPQIRVAYFDSNAQQFRQIEINDPQWQSFILNRVQTLTLTDSQSRFSLKNPYSEESSRPSASQELDEFSSDFSLEPKDSQTLKDQSPETLLNQYSIPPSVEQSEVQKVAEIELDKPKKPDWVAFENYVKEHCTGIELEKAKSLAKEGLDIIQKLKTGQFVKRKNLQHQLCAVCWALTLHAITKKQAFVDGTFDIKDPNHRLFDFFSPILYGRSSSHYTQRAIAVTQGEWRGYKHFGLEMDQMPANKRTVMIGRIATRDGSDRTYFKMESWGANINLISDPDARKNAYQLIFHGLEFFESQAKRNAPSLFGEIGGGLGMKKEHMLEEDKKTLKILKKEIEKVTPIQLPFDIDQYGFQDALPYLKEALFKKEVVGHLRDQIELFLASVQKRYDNLTYRKGNEVNINDSILTLQTSYINNEKPEPIDEFQIIEEKQSLDISLNNKEEEEDFDLVAQPQDKTKTESINSEKEEDEDFTEIPATATSSREGNPYDIAYRQLMKDEVLGSATIQTYVECLNKDNRFTFVGDFLYSENVERQIKTKGESFLKEKLHSALEEAKEDKLIYVPVILENPYVGNSVRNWVGGSFVKGFFPDHIVIFAIDPKKKAIEYYNSQGGKIENEGRFIRGFNQSAKDFLGQMKEFLEGKSQKQFSVSSNENKHQIDHYNCGAFVSRFMKLRQTHSFKMICDKKEVNIAEVRANLANEIKRKDPEGDFQAKALIEAKTHDEAMGALENEQKNLRMYVEKPEEFLNKESAPYKVNSTINHRGLFEQIDKDLRRKEESLFSLNGKIPSGGQGLYDSLMNIFGSNSSISRETVLQCMTLFQQGAFGEIQIKITEALQLWGMANFQVRGTGNYLNSRQKERKEPFRIYDITATKGNPAIDQHSATEDNIVIKCSCYYELYPNETIPDPEDGTRDIPNPIYRKDNPYAIIKAEVYLDLAKGTAYRTWHIDEIVDEVIL